MRGVVKMDIKENSIIIVEDSYKEKFIEEFRRDHDMFAVTILGLKEFKKKYYFDYTKEAIFYVHRHYDVIKENAEMYIENIYYIDAETDAPKVRFLRALKEDLEEHGFLERDIQFRAYLKDKDIALYHLDSVDNFYTRMFDELSSYANVYYIDEEERVITKKPLYKLQNRELEVAFVASEISNLLKRGIPIDDIKIANANSSYAFTLKRVFREFGIPLELETDDTIAGSLVVSKFKELFSKDIATTLENLRQFIVSENDEYVYDKILDVLNDYYWVEDYEEVADFIFSDLAKIKTKRVTYNHAIRTIDIMNDHIGDEDYIFLINFNQGSIPSNKKDEDYLSDDIKRSLGLSDSIDLNKKKMKILRNIIGTAKNLVVTYSARDLSGELYISNAYDENLFTNETPLISFEHSNTYNKRVLLSDKDENKKYGTMDDSMRTLLAHYPNEPYGTFDNAWKGIPRASLKEYLENKLVLSYSSMDHYFKCAFRYYLDSVVKIDKFEDSFATVTGTIFHEVLSKCFLPDFDFDSTWIDTLERQEFPFGNMENFYLGILKEELRFIIDNLNVQRNYTKLDSALYEQRIEVPVDGQDGVIFKGFVDKILYNSEGDMKVAAIIDYKTGHPELSLDDIIYGLDMQLPVYAYLLKHFEPLEYASIGGFYLQKILNNETEEEKKTAALKLQGYSNKNPRILGYVDTTYEDSSLIKSLKMSKGDFYSYAKVLTDNQIDKMINLVEEKIKEAAQNILDANFAINPKEIAGDNRGCQFCKYRDICYVKNDDIVKLAKMKKEDFLGGEEDGLD